jgi:hypothetical protein
MRQIVGPKVNMMKRRSGFNTGNVVSVPSGGTRAAAAKLLNIMLRNKRVPCTPDRLAWQEYLYTWRSTLIAPRKYCSSARQRARNATRIMIQQL